MDEIESDLTPTVIYEVEAPEFYYSATLRIYGDIPSLDGITSRLGLVPTHEHRRGERKGKRSPPYKNDHWSYMAPVSEEEPLDVHIAALWEAIRPHTAYLKELKNHLKVDIFCGFRTNCRITGIEVQPASLEIFRVLKVPFGLSIIVLDEED